MAKGPRWYAGRRFFFLSIFAALLLLGAKQSAFLRAWWRWGASGEPLLVPVEGVRADDVRSTWHAPRSGGRQHQGADIFAPKGTPVISATPGAVVRVGVDSLGGNVVWVVGPGPALYYYAHLDDWGDVRAGQTVRAGTVLGFVGNTGNARTTPSHLHFGVYRWKVFRVKAVDPVPLLRRTPHSDVEADVERTVFRCMALRKSA